MRKYLIAWTALALLPACSDPEAARQQQARQQFNAGVALIEEAEQGFVPTSPDQPRDADLQAFRHQKYQQAIETLTPVADNGPPALQVAAHRLIADLRAADARRLTRQAMTSWSALSVRSATILRTLLSAEQAGARATLIHSDESGLIAQLQSYQSEQQRKLDAYSSDLAQHRTQSADLQRQIDELTARATAAQQQAQALRDRAFTRPDPEKFELMNQAGQTQRQAEVDTVKSEELAVRLSVFQAQAAILQSQAQLAQTALDDLKAQIQATRDRQKTARDMQDQAAEQKDQEIKNLIEQFEQLARDQSDQVGQVFTQAADQLAKAQQDLAAAAAAVSGAQLPDVRLEQLANYLDQVHILGQHVEALGSYGVTVQSLARRAQAAMPQRAPFFTSHAQQIAGKQAELIDRAVELIQQAAVLASDLSAGRGENDPVGQSALEYSLTLQNYRQRVESARLSG